MVKKISEIQKKEMVDSFINGKTIEELSKIFNCTKNTITRHLKKNINENEYTKLIKKYSQIKKSSKNIEQEKLPDEISYHENNCKKNDIELPSHESSFVEITPLNFDIDNTTQKDFSSIPLSDINFPDVVYMIVNSKIELEIKLLKEYPEWEFLSENELSRKTIEIFYDLKTAKRSCSREQKVIKVPNTNVFKIARPQLRARGISRIVTYEKLISI